MPKVRRCLCAICDVLPNLHEQPRQLDSEVKTPTAQALLKAIEEGMNAARTYKSVYRKILSRANEIDAAEPEQAEPEPVAWTFPHEVEELRGLPRDYGDTQITLRMEWDESCSVPLYTGPPLRRRMGLRGESSKPLPHSGA